MTAAADRGPRLSAEEFEALSRTGVPFVGRLGCTVERFAAGEVTVRLPYADHLLRPGGTICGPALMALADITLYGTVLSRIGRVELAVTSDLNFHFLARPEPADVIAEGRLLKLGRRLAIGEVEMRSAGNGRHVCHAVGTYAIPPEGA